MKIDTDAFVDSLPIMGNGLLGIFIVTIVIIVSIYILRAITSRKAESEGTSEPSLSGSETAEASADPAASLKKESAMDLMREREKKDFLETDDSFTISKDL